jgi:hypothetical protein
MMETQAITHRCLEPFQWESLRGWDFRPELIVVSGVFGGNPFVDGILGHNLLLSQAFFGGNPFVDGILGHNLLLSRAFFHNLFFLFYDGILAIKKPLSQTFLFHDGILAIRKPFSRTFFTMELWLSRSLFHKLFFFTMEFWLSGSLSHEFFLFHDGTLAIRKPFSRIFLFSRWNSGYQEAFLTNFSFFTMELSKCAIWGKTLFIYITKSIYIGSASLKTLPLDLEPLCKEKSTVLLSLMQLRK